MKDIRVETEGFGIGVPSDQVAQVTITLSEDGKVLDKKTIKLTSKSEKLAVE